MKRKRRWLQKEVTNEHATPQLPKSRRALRCIGYAVSAVVLVVILGIAILWLSVQASRYVVVEAYLQTENTLSVISPGDGMGIFTTPSISPVGDEAVFHGAVTGFSRIWRYTQENGATVALTDDDYVAVQPSYSWDGTLIAFSADRGIDQQREDMSSISNNIFKLGQMYLGGNPQVMNIYIMNADGSNLRQLTTRDALDTRPTFSPDGQHILFMSTLENSSRDGLHLFTVAVAGEEVPQLIPNSEGAYRPWYSIDGEWIYYWTEIDGRGTLSRMASDGSEWHSLADDTGGKGSHGPFVDPSGEWLWFHSLPDRFNQIFKMPIHGGDPISVTPPGFEEEQVAHVTAASNGNYVFDVIRVLMK